MEPTAAEPAGVSAPRSVARASRAIARTRRRQLELALTGRVIESAHYARRALRLRRAVCDAAGLPVC